MARRSGGMALGQIRALFNLGVIGERTDGQLLERFATSPGEAAELAFAALVERHGPMVLRICRGVLRDPNDVEDAFQATFLVLVRRARSLWVEDSLGPWIHRVARRIALRARADASLRRDRERRAAEARPATVPGAGHDDSLMALLHDEIDRLPERCRVPVVLCDVQGMTHEQAARHLGWPIGTVKSRLMKGRERLRARLGRRGIAPATAATTLMMARPARSAAGTVPAGLMDAAVRSARLVAAGAKTTVAGAVPATVDLLMEGALDAMFVTRIKVAVLACGLIAGGAVVAAQQVSRVPRSASPRPVSVPAAARPDGPGDGKFDAARETAQLEVGLLEDEVKLIRSLASDLLKTKVQYETSVSNVDPKAWEEAEAAYQRARAVYLKKAGELASARRRVGKVEDPAKGDNKASGDAAPGEDHAGDRKATEAGSRGSGAVIGSIDMGAILKRYGKVRQYNQRLSSDRDDARAGIAKLQSEVKAIAGQMERLSPGGADYRAREERIAALKKRIERESEGFQAELTQRQARESASVLEDIQEVIAEVAKAKGMDYIVKVSPEPQPDASPNDVIAAFNRSVLYANPRNDITDEVIRELNRRFDAAGVKDPR